jgi:hypothetical protein
MKTLSENTNKLWLMPILTIIAAVVGYGTGQDWLRLLGTGGGIATIVPILVEFIKAKVWDFSGKTWLFKYPTSRWVTWGLCFILCAVSFWVGLIEKFNLFYGVVYTILTGLAANRYFHWSEIEWLLALLTGRDDKVALLKDKFLAETKVENKHK